MPSIQHRRPALSASAPLARTLLALAALHALAGCTAVSNTFGSNKVDYRALAQPASTLDVPPDLTQLSSDPRYQPPTGAAISANALQASGTPAGTASAGNALQGVAPRSTDTLRLERVGGQRWLVSSQTPEQLWPQLQEFWRLNGFSLIVDRPEVGVMETDWLENRAKLPRDGLSRLIGKAFDALTDSGERDRYRLLVERGRQGSEITITHQGASQVVIGERSSNTEQVRWQSRPADPSLEAEMLARLMVVLNGPTPTSPEATRIAVEEAGKQVAAAPSSPARARLDDRAGAPTLQVDEGFDRAWRRVGLALDRSGFTVEDRDRSQGLYFVRYVDPKLAGKEDPGFFARLFGAKKQDLSGQRYRVKVAAEGQGASTVAVLDAEGGRAADESARSIAQLLLNELR